jgi:hypothetical protein
VAPPVKTKQGPWSQQGPGPVAAPQVPSFRQTPGCKVPPTKKQDPDAIVHPGALSGGLRTIEQQTEGGKVVVVVVPVPQPVGVQTALLE